MQMEVKKLFKDVNIPRNVGDKETFGDVDLYVSPCEETNEHYIHAIKNHFNIEDDKIVIHDHIHFSIFLKNAEMADLICNFIEIAY